MGYSYDGSQGDGSFRVPGISMFRQDFNSATGDYGHYWTEMFGERAYIWWPAKDVDSGSKLRDFYDSMVGVPGSLNQGQAMDPKAGERGPGIREFVVMAPLGTDMVKLTSAIQSFSQNYRASWNIHLNSCQTFQEEIINRFNLRIVEARNK
jgi:hypothetical protein